MFFQWRYLGLADGLGTIEYFPEQYCIDGNLVTYQVILLKGGHFEPSRNCSRNPMSFWVFKISFGWTLPFCLWARCNQNAERTIELNLSSRSMAFSGFSDIPLLSEIGERRHRKSRIQSVDRFFFVKSGERTESKVKIE